MSRTSCGQTIRGASRALIAFIQADRKSKKRLEVTQNLSGARQRDTIQILYR
jgi:hypothetical protein